MSEVKNKRLHGEIMSFKGKDNVSFRHESLHINDFKKENEMLRKKNLDKLLCSQKYIFDKEGIGYKPNLKQNYYKNYFVKATCINDHQIICHYCNRNGHKYYAYPTKKNAYLRVKNVWVPNRTITNTQVDKKIWVPKT